MKRRKLINLAAATLLVLLIPTSIAFAEREDPPPNPGVGDGQGLILARTVLWLLPHGSDLFIDDEAGDIILDWDNVDVGSTEAPVDGLLAINTVGGEPVGEEDICPQIPLVQLVVPDGMILDNGECVPEEHPNQTHKIVICHVPYGNPGNAHTIIISQSAWNVGCMGANGHGSHGPGCNGGDYLGTCEGDYEPDNNCPDVWVNPGAITISGGQIAPDFAVIVGQDPDQTGVTLEWQINIDPTVVTYETWEIVDYNILECVENDPYGYQYHEGYGHDDYWENGGAQNRYGCGHFNCGCEFEWYPVVEEVWGCVQKEIVYPEGINELIAGASLNLDSRAWIEGELASVYPGAYLIHPDWGVEVPTECNWIGDTCALTVTDTLAVADPGWYDIKLVGTTAGTLATPPRSFNDIAGTFGVFMLENTALTQ